MDELVKLYGKIEMVHVTYQGSAPMKVDLLAGRLQLGGDQVSSSLAEVKRGSLKALATLLLRKASLSFL
jgi:tripartite-type tricarboxylate transporter receptor subunit TctC